MAMFYFHLSDERPIVDIDGTDLPDVDAAWTHALAVARELTSNSTGMLGHAWSDWTMSVRDAGGREVFSFPMSHAGTSQARPSLRAGGGRMH